MKKYAQFVKLIAVVILVFIAATIGTAHSAEVPQVKGVIMLIGDGMGINQIRCASIYAQRVLGKALAMDSIHNRGTTTTHSANSEVTDSAAAATALYTGHKTNNGAINVLPDGTKAFTIGEAAKKAGLAVGLVSTARLTDATPAGMYCQVPDRKLENIIAEQLTAFLPDVAMGGALSHFIPQAHKGSKRQDQTSLVEVMKTKGYTYVAHADDLKAVDLQTCRTLFGLFASSHMAYDIDRQNDPKLGSQPALADMARAALAIVARNPRGFFLMIEGARIDHACHAHDLRASIGETLAFDEAVSVALEFQKNHPDVLVLVTADHETGGLGLGRGTEYAVDIPALQPIRNSLEYMLKHIDKQPDKLVQILTQGGFDLTDTERALVFKYPPETKVSSVVQLGTDMKKMDNNASPWLGYALGHIESERAKIGWTTFGHTAQPVMTCAEGPAAAEFAGHYDNTDIPKKLARLLGLTLEIPCAQ